MPSPYRLHREQWIPAPRDAVFRFFSDALNLEALTPAWLHFRVLTEGAIAMKPGAEIRYALGWRFFPIRWATLIEEWNPPEQFLDRQARGPYRLWRHTHTFREENGATRMLDSVEYALPFGIFGRLAHNLQVRRDLDRIFDYRAARIREIFPPPGRT